MIKILNEEIVNTEGYQLNPKLFDENDQMKPEIRERLLEIADEFLSQLDMAYFKVLDIILVGSNAAYNYSEYSDIDLHIVTDFEQLCKDCPDTLLRQLFDAEKAKFNLKYDITVKGIKVEVYIEDVKVNTQSNGIYSVLKDEWIKVPNQIGTNDLSAEIHNMNWDEDFQSYVNRAEEALTSGSATEIEDMINDIYLLRKYGLASDDGELSKGNIMFKELRNQGILDQLKDKYYEVRSDELTLEGLIEVEPYD